MAYRYLNRKTGKPLRQCPGCGHPLTEVGGVMLCLASNGGHVYYTGDQLDEDGCLLDLDGEVADGKHSGTECSSCGELLIDFDSVDEVEV